MDASNLPFDVVGFLSEGAAGAVYEVRRPPDPRRLVAKVLKSSSPIARERLRREGELVARLDAHPGIVRVVAAGELPDGTPYLLFELIEGRPLRDLMRLGPLEPARVLGIARQLAGALAHAHAHGVVHRDVKPENVLLSEERVLLGDFGLAIAADMERLTGTQGLVGTPLYLAPEQLPGSGREIGPWTDVHALGLVLHEALSGKPAFDASDAERLARSIRSHVPPPLAGALPGVEPALDAVLARCLTKDPAARYPEAGELLADLERLERGETPLAQLQARRRGPVLAFAALALASLALATGAALRASQVRSEGQASAAARLLTEARADLEAGRGSVPRLDELAALAAQEPGAAGAEARVLEAQLALLGCDLARAGACLERLERSGAPVAELALIRAGRVALDPEVIDPQRLREALSTVARAQASTPARAWLGEWRARLAVRLGRPEEATEALAAAPAAAPALRFELMLLAGQVEAAEALRPQVQEPTLRGELDWLQAEAWLSGHGADLTSGDAGLEGLRQPLERGLRDAPASARKATCAAALRAAAEAASDWTPASGASEGEEARLEREITLHGLLQRLDGAHRLAPARCQALERPLQAASWRHRGQARDLCEAALALAPDFEPFYRVFASVAVQDGFLRPAEDARKLRRYFELTHQAGKRLAAPGLAMALAKAGQLAEIERLAAELDSDDPSAAGWVLAVLARARIEQGDPAAALEVAGRVEERAPALGAVHETRFRALRALGRPDEATQAAWRYLEQLGPMEARFPGEGPRQSEAITWVASHTGAGKEVATTVRALRLVLARRPDAVELVAVQLRARPSLELVDLLEEALRGWRRALAEAPMLGGEGRDGRERLQAAIDDHLRETVPRARVLVQRGAPEELERLLRPLAREAAPRR